MCDFIQTVNRNFWSCPVSEILHLLYAKSHFFHSPHPISSPAKSSGCSLWSRSMTGTAVRDMRSKHTIAVIADSLLDTPDTWSGSRQARQWVFIGHITITAVQCTHVTCLEHWTDTVAAGRVNTSDTALQHTQTSLHYSLTVSTGWTDETRHHHYNTKWRVHTRDACRLHAGSMRPCMKAAVRTYAAFIGSYVGFIAA